MARILLVDDYADALDVWTLYLKMCGFDVDAATDGLAALEMVRRQCPDAAILDLELPGLSGLDLARRLRCDERASAIPLIAMTGHSQRARIDEALAAGFNLVITKPCDPDRLSLEIRRLLGVGAVPDATVNRHGGSHQR